MQRLPKTMTNPPVEPSEAMVVEGASAIVDLWLPDTDWRSRMDESKWLESADWQTALEHSRAALIAAMQSAATPSPVGEVREVVVEIAKEGVGAALDWSAEECSDYWSGIVFKNRKLAADLLSRLGSDSGWRTIDSAPKDGTVIDLYVEFPDKSYRWADAAWMEAGEHVCSGPANWCSKERIPLHGFVDNVIATRWMPLPAPPSSDPVGEREG